MHVLHLIYTFEVGGAETMLVDIINGQIARGLDVTLLIVNKGIDSGLAAKLDPRTRIVAMERRQGSKPLLMMVRLNLLIARLRPDIIHAHHHKFGRLVRVRRGRLLLTIHDMNEPMVYCGGCRMVAITDAVADNICQRVPGARVTTILNGIRTADIAVRRPGAPSGNLRLVQVARLLASKKGQDVLISALGELRRHGIEDVEVTFIGNGPDLAQLRNLAKDENVADRVHFDGLRDREYIYAHLADFDAMVHPSRYEGFGLTVAEGMAAGLPLLVTRGDGPWEVADHGRLCGSFAAGDVQGCADAIAALRAGYSFAAARADEARAYVRRFDIANTVDGYISFYHGSFI